VEGGLPWLLGIVGEPQVVAGVFSVNQGMAWGLIHLLVVFTCPSHCQP